MVAVAVAFTLVGSAITAPLRSTVNSELDVAHSGGDYGPLDPALATFPDQWKVLYSTCLKLVNWPDASGKAGEHLVPDGAAAMPLVTNRGRTYTFTIRPGQRFSDGTAVTAASFKAPFDRDADPKMASQGASWVNDIVGVDAELQGKATGVSGVVATGMTLTIHVKRAAPTLLERLAMPYFCAIPANTAHDPNGIDTIPSAGPYYIASRAVGRNLLLEQNPYYTGSRPRRAVKIKISTGDDATAAYEQVRLGQYATDLDGPPFQFFTSLVHEYGINKGRFFVSPALSVYYLALNTTRPALRNPAVRRAINYAIDRHYLITALTGSFLLYPSASLLPPDIAGGVQPNPYPYTPNIPKAKAILAKAHAKCGRLVYWIPANSPPAADGAALVQSELAYIGCKVVPEIIPGDFRGAAALRGAAFDIIPDGWFVDYPDAYDVLYHLLDGNTITPKNNFNLSYMDNPNLNAAIDKANQLPLGRARVKAFAKLDYDTMRDLAPVVAWADGNNIAFLAGNAAGYVNSVFGAIGIDLDMLYQK
jgi:peptide/nickel transport system substrate-binding protein